jgi:hypothetical protein
MYVSDRWLSWLSTCMYLTVDFPGLVHVCIWPLTFLAWYMFVSGLYQARKVNGQIHICTKPGKSTVRYIHVPSQESQRSDTYMYQARKVNGQIHTCTNVSNHWLSWLGTCMYLTVDLPGLVHVCIWPLTFLAWYMYVSDHWLSWLSTCMYLPVAFCTKPGKSTVRYIHVLSQESQRSDTYMYQARKVNGQIHTCAKPGKSTVRYIHVLSQESQLSDTYMY